MRKHKEAKGNNPKRNYRTAGLITPKVISIRTLQNESAFETIGFARTANKIISGEIILLNILPEFLGKERSQNANI